MGSDPISSIARVALATSSFGLSEALGVGKKVSGKKIKTNTAGAAADVSADKEANLKRRKALYETGGGALGEQVGNVGTVGRQNLFGN